MHDKRLGLNDKWSLLLALAACVPKTDNGGELVDEGSGSLGSESGDDGMTSQPTAGPDTGSVGETEVDDGTCPPEVGAPCPDPASLCGPAPECGNSVIDAGEECDGTQGCEACAALEEPSVVVALIGMQDLVVGGDDSLLALVQPNRKAPMELHRYDAGGTQQWVVTSPFASTWPGAIALDASGNAYWATGNVETRPTSPYIASWAPDGTPRWDEASAVPSFFNAIAIAGDLVVATALLVDSETDAGVIRAYDTDGALQWQTQHALSPEALALAGSEVVAVFRQPTPIAAMPAHLLRFDADGVERWSVPLPTEDGITMQRHHVIADGLGGSWVGGLADMGPWAAHHDADGNELEVIDCLGGHNGWIEALTLDAAGQPVFSVYVNSGTEPYNFAWVAHVQDGVVTRATSFIDGGADEHVSVLARGSDGALFAGRNSYGEEGGPGNSTVMILSP